MILQMVIALVEIGFSVGVGIYFHEMGHVIAYKKKTGITPKMKFKYDCNGMTDENYRVVLESGLVLGVLGAILTAYLMNSITQIEIPILFLTFIGYLSGCFEDIKNLYKLRKKNGQ